MYIYIYIHAKGERNNRSTMNCCRQFRVAEWLETLNNRTTIQATLIKRQYNAKRKFRPRFGGRLSPLSFSLSLSLPPLSANIKESFLLRKSYRGDATNEPFEKNAERLAFALFSRTPRPNGGGEGGIGRGARDSRPRFSTSDAQSAFDLPLLPHVA